MVVIETKSMSHAEHIEPDRVGVNIALAKIQWSLLRQQIHPNAVDVESDRLQTSD